MFISDQLRSYNVAGMIGWQIRLSEPVTSSGQCLPTDSVRKKKQITIKYRELQRYQELHALCIDLISRILTPLPELPLCLSFRNWLQVFSLHMWH